MALKTDVISVYELDEASGNAIDSHGSHDMTEGGTVGASSGPGGVGGSRDFEEGELDYFSLASHSGIRIGDVDMGVAAWVNLESKSSGAKGIVGEWGSMNSERPFLLYYDNTTDRFLFVVRSTDSGNTSAVVTASNFGSPSTGTWNHVVVWHDSVNNLIGISVNGGTANTTSWSGGVLSTTQPLYIGRQNVTYFDGKIAQVALRKGSFWTSGERTSLYAGGNGLPYSSWDASGTTVTPSPVVASWSIPSPTLRKTRTVSPVSATWSTPAPTLRKSRTVEPVTATWATPAPTLAKRITPDPVTTTWTVNATTLAKSTTSSPVVSTWTITTPGLAKSIALAAVVAQWTVTTPITSNATVIQVTPVVANWTIPAPTLVKATSPDPVIAQWTITQTDLAKTITVDPVPATWSIGAVTAVKSTTPGPVTANWSITTIATSKRVRPSPVTATWTINAVTTSADNPPPTFIQFVNESFKNPSFLNETFANPSFLNETFRNPQLINETFTE